LSEIIEKCSAAYMRERSVFLRLRGKGGRAAKKLELLGVNIAASASDKAPKGCRCGVKVLRKARLYDSTNSNDGRPCSTFNLHHARSREWRKYHKVGRLRRRTIENERHLYGHGMSAQKSLHVRS